MVTPYNQLSPRLELAVSAAEAAGNKTLDYFGRNNYEVERKGDDSPVTAADREAELVLRRQIADHFPDDGIVGEEFGQQAGTSGFEWILDPIDGTKTFICGVPLYSTLVGLLYRGQSVAGVIRIPALDECVYAAAEGETWHVVGGAGPQRARVSQRSRLEDCVFATSQVDTFAARGAAETFLGLQQVASITRTWGDGYGYLLVATGRVDIMLDPAMNLWDAAALLPIIVGAGGRFTDWRGAATVAGGDAVATNGLVHDAVLDFTRQLAK